VLPGKWGVFFFALCGLAHSGIYPSLLAMTGKIYREYPGTAMGILSAGGGLGSIFLPWLMSFVSQLTNLTFGFLTFEIFVILSLILLGIQYSELKRRIPRQSFAGKLQILTR
jgi:nitrate/nitrite transporter NarK